MPGFIARRLLEGAVVLIASVTLIFFLGRLSGDPTYLILPQEASEADRVALRSTLGLDRPPLAQYVDYVLAGIRGDFGRSYFEPRSVQAIILDHLPYTLRLAGIAILITVLTAIPLGIVSAVFRNSPLDRIAQSFALAGYSMPSFWSAILLIQVFGVWLGWLPTFGAATAWHLILPSVNLALYSSARVTRVTRSAMAEVLREDYIRTARAKGVAHVIVVARHALRNALLPIVTLVGLEFGILMGGAVLTETVFAWPGIGWLVIESVSRRDFPVVQGIIGYVAGIFVLITLLVDITYTFINPKVRY